MKKLVARYQNVDLPLDIRKVAATLLEFADQGWSQVDITTESEPYSSDTYPVCRLRKEELETDAEYEKRLAQEKVQADRQDEWNRKEFARLSELFRNTPPHETT